MSFIGFDEILHLADGKNAAIPAFNCYNTETVMAAVRAAESLRSPVILQGYSRLFTSDTGYYLAALIRAAAERAAVPVCFHLDHGAGSLEVTRALRYGCSGVMFDASCLPLEQNIAATKAMVEICAYAGVAVEGELGRIGLASDGVSEQYTAVDEAVEFCAQTGITALAPQVGTAHGRYTKPPKLAISRIREIAEATNLPLVLHGGSGIPDDQITAAIAAGIKKINFGTDICRSFLDAVFTTSRDKAAIDLFMSDATEAVKTFCSGKIALLGSGGLA